ASARVLCRSGDACERLRNNKAARAPLLDGEADRIEPNRADAGAVQPIEDAGEVPLRFGMRHVDVDLIAREGGPQEKRLPARSLVCGERKIRAWGVQREEVRLAPSRRRQGARGQNEPRG